MALNFFFKILSLMSKIPLHYYLYKILCPKSNIFIYSVKIFFFFVMLELFIICRGQYSRAQLLDLVISELFRPMKK